MKKKTTHIYMIIFGISIIIQIINIFIHIFSGTFKIDTIFLLIVLFSLFGYYSWKYQKEKMMLFIGEENINDEYDEEYDDEEYDDEDYNDEIEEMINDDELNYK